MGASVSIEQSREEIRRKQLAIYGVLVPPLLFEPLPLSSAVSLMQQDTPTALWDAIITRSPGHRLLQEYLKPGIWLAGSSTTERSTVLAAFDFDHRQFPQFNRNDVANDDSHYAAGGGDGMLCLSHSFHPNLNLHLSAPTRGVPSLTLVQSLTSFAHLRTNMNASGNVWIGGSLEINKINRNHPSWLGIRKVVIGSAAEFQFANHTSEVPLATTHLSSNSLLKDEQKMQSGDVNTVQLPITKLHGLAGVDIHGTLLAITADVCVPDVFKSQPTLHHLQTLLHTNLNLDEQPPLWFTAQAQPLFHGNYSLQVCQTLSFDRYVWNVMEDRAPRIRNALTWTVEMTNTKQHSSLRGMPSSASATSATTQTVLNEEDSYSTTSNDGTTVHPTTNHSATPTRLTAGVAWQFNRNLAIKAVTTPAEGSIRGAVVFKRWKQPRLSCSMIGEYNMWNRHGRFVGVGLELGSIENSCADVRRCVDRFNDLGGRSTEEHVGVSAVTASPISTTPETKVILPR